MGLTVSAAGRGAARADERWTLRLAIEHLLRVRRCSGRALSAVLAQYTFQAVVRREDLSALRAVYAYVEKHYRLLWPSVLRELRWAQSLIPPRQMRES